MYSALNEDFLLQEARDRRRVLQAAYAGSHHDAHDQEPRRWWRRGVRRTR